MRLVPERIEVLEAAAVAVATAAADRAVAEATAVVDRVAVVRAAVADPVAAATAAVAGKRSLRVRRPTVRWGVPPDRFAANIPIFYKISARDCRKSVL